MAASEGARMCLPLERQAVPENSCEAEITLSVCLLASGREVAKVTLSSRCTVRTLKKRLMEIEGTPTAQQRLLLDGTVLTNGQLISEVGLSQGDTVHLVRVHPPPTAVFSVKMVNSAGITILEQEKDHSLEPTEDDVDEYAEWLGMDPDADGDLLWIAKEGLMAKVDYPWHVCQNNDGEYFYYNFETRESSWDHPNDEAQREKYRVLKAQREAAEKQRQSGTGASEPSLPLSLRIRERLVGGASCLSPGTARSRAASAPSRRSCGSTAAA